MKPISALSQIDMRRAADAIECTRTSAASRTGVLPLRSFSIRGAISMEKAALAQLSMHHHRQGRMLQDVPRHAAESLLPQTRVAYAPIGSMSQLKSLAAASRPAPTM